MRKANWHIYTIVGILTIPLFVFVLLPLFRFLHYQPEEGDIVFQSLNRSVDLVRAIEGITESEYSHCGVVIKKEGEWWVNEAFGRVASVPLSDWILRGRGFGFDVYRLRDGLEVKRQFIEELDKYQGKPYDSRYRMDDESIYCSELAYKAYFDATGKHLGELETLGSLNWKPYETTIRKYERGAPPLDRKMITPISLSRSEFLMRIH